MLSRLVFVSGNRISSDPPFYRSVLCFLVGVRPDPVIAPGFDTKAGRDSAPLCYSAPMTPAHVVIATGLYPPEIGGPATFSAFFERELRARSIPCTVIPFSTVRFLPKFVRHAVYAWHVFSAARKGSVVFALDPVSVGLPAFLAARGARAPFFLRVGGDYAWEQATQRFGFTGLPEELTTVDLPFAGKFLARIQSFVARRAERILVQSSYMADIVARWGVARGRIVVVPNGVTPETLTPREALRTELSLGPGPIIVSAGRFVPWKGFLALIRAATALSREMPGLRLLLAGSGPDEAALRAEVARLNAPVTFLGNVPRERLLRMVAAADVFALNTRYEGFSHQILEAMSVGTPVVTTDIGGNNDLAGDGTTALLVPWNHEEALREALRRFLSDPGFAQTRAEAGRARAAFFTHERTFGETCAALGIRV